MMELDEKWSDDSSGGRHKYQNQIPWQSIQQLSRHFSQNLMRVLVEESQDQSGLPTDWQINIAIQRATSAASLKTQMHQ